MKTTTTLLLFCIFITLTYFVKGTGKDDRKKKGSTSDSKHNDDPGKVTAFCMKYGTIDTVFLQIDKGICGSYQFDSLVISQSNPYFHLLSVGTSTLLDTNYNAISAPPANASYLIPIQVQIDALPSGIIASQGLVLLTANMIPTGANTPIECSRSKISIYLYISEEGCNGNPDTTFTTGKCFKCSADSANQFPQPTYAHFTWSVGAYNYITFTDSSYCQIGDTLVWNFDDGQDTTMIYTENTQISVTHHYDNDNTYTPELLIKCRENHGKCIYRAKTRLKIANSLPITSILATFNTINESRSVDFRWTTVSGLAPVKYRIKRNDLSGSANSTEWKQIGETGNFTFTDKQLEYGRMYYYSIEGLDANGTMIASTDSIAIILQGNISIFPNPTKDKINIVVDIQEVLNAKSTQTVLSDLNGRIVFQSDEIPPSIDMSNLPSGVYMLRIANRRERIAKE